MKLKRVVIASKKTSKEYFQEAYGPSYHAMLKRFDLEFEEVEHYHNVHYEALNKLVAAFHTHGIVPEQRLRRAYGPGDFDEVDLVVSFGGDGEMLDVARYILANQPVLGVRSSPKSHGVLLSPADVDYTDMVRDLVAHRFTMRQWTRVRGVLYDGTKTYEDAALNEIYVGDLYSVGTARYTLYVNGAEEKQKSSGILVVTGTGSTGWYANILRSPGDNEGTLHGGTSFPREARELHYVVRDPIYKETLSWIAGTIDSDMSFSIKSTMNQDGIVSFDCSKRWYDNPRVYDFNRGSVLTVTLSDKPLHVVEFD